MDIPDIEIIMLGELEKPGGIGEAPVVPVAGALANAIFNATGVRVTRTPFTPKNILTALARG